MKKNKQALLAHAHPQQKFVQGLLWMDNVYPIRIHWLDPRYLFVKHNHENLIPLVMPR